MVNVWLLKEPDFANVETATRRYLVSVDFDLAAISPQWRDLESSGGLTPFQARAWLLPWYQIIAPAFKISPIFVTVRDQDSGRPMMLLPLCLMRERGIATIKFPDCGVSDYNSPLLSSPHILDDSVFLRFYKSVIFDSWTKGFGLLSALMVRDEVVATSFALNHHRRYLLLMHSFEPGHWHTRSPGILLMDSAITSQIESGATYFDFTIGNEVYKRKFCVAEHFLYSREQGLPPSAGPL